MIQILRTTSWHRKFGDPQSGGGVMGQVTHLNVNGVTAFVRENLCVDTFREISSGLRRAIARGARVPGVQVLELAVEATVETSAVWLMVAGVVAAHDAKHRRVVRNRAWTARSARALFTRDLDPVPAPEGGIGGGGIDDGGITRRDTRLTRAVVGPDRQGMDRVESGRDVAEVRILGRHAQPRQTVVQSAEPAQGRSEPGVELLPLTVRQVPHAPTLPRTGRTRCTLGGRIGSTVNKPTGERIR